MQGFQAFRPAALARRANADSAPRAFFSEIAQEAREATQGKPLKNALNNCRFRL
ncbi:hypothetical protein [Candidatus Glomeribacter gigasporarum]|uniref:hypothetical protein n=1 Tax=Candidatus Glomeribacter gigasporarum TaxID=132144 RepID=UPI0002D6E080|nr:hypothetical protein [Candidatus Glomeribacter gigasporarum]